MNGNTFLKHIFNWLHIIWILIVVWISHDEKENAFSPVKDRKPLNKKLKKKTLENCACRKYTIFKILSKVSDGQEIQQKVTDVCRFYPYKWYMAKGLVLIIKDQYLDWCYRMMRYSFMDAFIDTIKILRHKEIYQRYLIYISLSYSPKIRKVIFMTVQELELFWVNIQKMFKMSCHLEK